MWPVLVGFLIVFGVIVFAIGFLMIMAGGMSDAPDAANRSACDGMILCLISLALWVGAFCTWYFQIRGH